MKPDVVFQQSIFASENLQERWPQLKRLITSGHELAAAFELAQKDPRWKQDPRYANIAPGTAREILDFYNAVVADGRFIAELQTDPRGVANKLKIDISDLAFETVKSTIPLPGDNLSPLGLVIAGGSITVVGLAVATAIVSSAADPRAKIIIDESGTVKI